MNILIAVGVRRFKKAGGAGVAFNHSAEFEKLDHKVELWFLERLGHQLAPIMLTVSAEHASQGSFLP